MDAVDVWCEGEYLLLIVGKCIIQVHIIWAPQ